MLKIIFSYTMFIDEYANTGIWIRDIVLTFSQSMFIITTSLASVLGSIGILSNSASMLRGWQFKK